MFPYSILPAEFNVSLKPIIASIPHCGTYVPLEIEAKFSNETQRDLPMTDWYLHYLYNFLPSLGVTVIHSNVSRNVIDLNRSPVPLELYPGRFETKLIAEKTFQGEDIFLENPNEHQVTQYTKNVHEPYHRALTCLLQDRIKQFDEVYLLDLHSIAPDATLLHPSLEQDIYLGDRDGESCSEAWSNEVEELYQNCGYTTQRNSPYKGGFITHHYGQQDKVQALQVEMNQAVYLDVYERPKNDEDISVILEDKYFRSAKRKLEALFTNLVEMVKYT